MKGMELYGELPEAAVKKRRVDVAFPVRPTLAPGLAAAPVGAVDKKAGVPLPAPPTRAPSAAAAAADDDDLFGFGKLDAKQETAKSQPTPDGDDARQFAAAAGKLRAALLASGMGKLPKAVALLTQLMDARLSGATGLQFAELVAHALMTPPQRLTDPAARPAVLALALLVTRRRPDFGALPAPLQYELDTAILQALHHNELFTDDSFRFAKAATVLRDAILGLRVSSSAADSDSSTPSADLLTTRRGVLMLALETAFSSHKLPWARSSADLIFAAAKDTRLFFSETERDQLDTWATALQARKTAPVLVTSRALLGLGEHCMHTVRSRQAEKGGGE